MQYIRYWVSIAVPNKFTNTSVQQPGTYIHQARTSQSVKGYSCDMSKKRIADDSVIDPSSSFSRSSNRSRCLEPEVFFNITKPPTVIIKIVIKGCNKHFPPFQGNFHNIVYFPFKYPIIISTHSCICFNQ